MSACSIFPGLRPVGMWRAGLVVLVVMFLAGLKEARHYLWLDNFGVVEEGVLYRSGQLTAPQLRRVIKAYGLRTVINTREAEARVDAEAEVCRENGVRHARIPMPGDGRGAYSQYAEALDILRDPDNLPALVHCARGTHRTGAIVACYRVHVQGWDAGAAQAEMREYRFDPEGHPLPGHLLPFLKPVGVAEDARGNLSEGP